MAGARKREPEPNLAPTPARAQHFVSQGYLRPFARSDRSLRVYDLINDRDGRPKRPKSVAYGIGFYDLIDPETGETVSAEDWLAARVEEPGLGALRAATAAPSDFPDFDLAAQNAIARFLGASLFRGPEFRAQSDAIAEEMVAFAKTMARNYARNSFPPSEAEELIASWESLPDHRWLGREDAPQPAELAVGMLADVQGYANLFLTMDWSLHVAPSQSLKRELYTSDHPLSRRLRPVRGDFEWGALTDWSYQLPLDRHTLLKVRPWGSAPRTQKLGRRVVRPLTDWGVVMANSLTSHEAEQYVYGDGTVLSKEQARTILQRQDEAALSTASQLGWRPGPSYHPPRGGFMSSSGE